MPSMEPRFRRSLPERRVFVNLMAVGAGGIFTMSTSQFGIVAIIAYLAARAALVHSLHTDYITSENSSWQRLRILGLGWLAAALHGASLTDMCDRAGTVNFSFLSVSSLAGLSIVAILLLAALTKPVDKLGVVIFPLNAAIIFLKLAVPEEAHTLKIHSWQMDVHILVSMLAYSFLNMARLAGPAVGFARLAFAQPPRQGAYTLPAALANHGKTIVPTHCRRLCAARTFFVKRIFVRGKPFRPAFGPQDRAVYFCLVGFRGLVAREESAKVGVVKLPFVGL